MRGGAHLANVWLLQGRVMLYHCDLSFTYAIYDQGPLQQLDGVLLREMIVQSLFRPVLK